MKIFIILLSLGLAVASFGMTPDLKVGDAFPVIAMPRTNSGELESIQTYRGKKIMVHVFAGW